nr:reverse transcriptase domain-containing protein [Tanacetum cinerariifolium]
IDASVCGSCTASGKRFHLLCVGMNLCVDTVPRVWIGDTDPLHDYFVALDQGTRSVPIEILSFINAIIDSLLLTPLCCDDIHDVTPRVFALASNTIANPRGDLKAITTRSGVSYDGPPIPPPFSSLPKVVERVPEVIKDMPKPTIPYPSRVTKQKLREKDDNLALIFFEIFRKLHFDLSFADALLHMPKFALMFKSLLNNKEKLFDLATTPINENCSAVILKKFPKKLGDPAGPSAPPPPSKEVDREPKMITNQELTESTNNVHPSVVQLSPASTSFTPISSLKIPEVTKDMVQPSTKNIQPPVAYTQVPIDEPVVAPKLKSTITYPSRVTKQKLSCDEYVQEVLEFLEISKSGSLTPTSDPIISSSSPSFTPFEGGDILYLEKLLNEDPSLNLPPVKTEYLKQIDVTMTKPSIEKPPELELKELPSHLEYVFLERTDKLPVIISKELKDEEKFALLKVLKSYKWAIAWKISNIKDIDPLFCTHKILMEDDFKLAVQHQRRVSNRCLKRILERTIGENRASWFDKLDDAIWAFRTAFKTPIGFTPYKLVYRKACHLPIELEHKAYWALKHCNFDLKTAGGHRKVQLNELNELRDQAYENYLIYYEKTKKIHDSKIKNRIFDVGDPVILFNSRLNIFSGKLKTCLTGPFTVAHVFPYGTIELSQADGPNFKKTQTSSMMLWNAMLAIISPTIGQFDKAHDPKAEIDARGQSND